MNTDTFLKQLLFSTIRIVAEAGKSVGTGFLVTKKIDETQSQIFLVTNKHVIAQIDDNGKVVSKFPSGHFSFVKSENNSPVLGESIPIKIENLTDMFMLHPNDFVDLAIVNISDMYNHITQGLKQEIFIRGIPIEMIPSKEENFDVIEDIIFIGYPNGIFDEKNHLPIVRKGITASLLEVNFNGLSQFIIDAHVFPGSSGSPVFIKANPMRNGTLTLGQEKYFLAGVIARVFQRDEIGSFKKILAPTNLQDDQFSIRQMIGLGICEKSTQILELIDALSSKSEK